MEFRRHAIYFTPPPGPFARFGAAWLGWDPAAGVEVPHPTVAGLPAPVAGLTETPRRYGLHATLKPPFHVAPGHDDGALRAALDRFCAAHAPVTLPALELAEIGGFLALQPRAHVPALDTLAAEVVRNFDGFRAPLTEAELARRRAARLNPAQEANLRHWGYPYVLDEFRFHMTLTGRLPLVDRAAIRAALAPHLDAVLAAPFAIDALSLMGEDAHGYFHLIHRQTLSG